MSRFFVKATLEPLAIPFGFPRPRGVGIACAHVQSRHPRSCRDAVQPMRLCGMHGPCRWVRVPPSRPIRPTRARLVPDLTHTALIRQSPPTH